jgi:hypothetical protein
VTGVGDALGARVRGRRACRVQERDLSQLAEVVPPRAARRGRLAGRALQPAARARADRSDVP